MVPDVVAITFPLVCIQTNIACGLQAGLEL